MISKESISKKILFSFMLGITIVQIIDGSFPSIDPNLLQILTSIENNDIRSLETFIARHRNLLLHRDEFGTPVLHVAVMQNNPTIVRTILEANEASVFTLNTDEDTPLALALRIYHDTPATEITARSRLLEIINLLIDHGADIFVQTLNMTQNNFVPVNALVPALTPNIIARYHNRSRR